ncbi:uncharacterized protein MELLADRAFT_105299 [Melampsora larici-populina 98AG31]|uniref:Uncharacterized protein n=1 Tax=Melampsora larici-populina (strain 98AG31 / pathotype 3-4-7) TaxID=747676 RepID=F4RHN4_MELLP|nr:uncharacterized protein MELLADRAFT_105299 [Melampsora larici-populina 98AG31]EGG07855.1 hypothetical protein MELLADRAFT_105299 [Melampsora larici-populina 98AG31]
MVSVSSTTFTVIANPDGDGNRDDSTQSKSPAPPESSTSLVSTALAKRNRPDRKRSASPNGIKPALKKRTVSAKVASTNSTARSAINKKAVRFRSLSNGELSGSQLHDQSQSTSQNAGDPDHSSKTPLVEPKKLMLSEGGAQDEHLVIGGTTRGNQKVNQKVRRPPTPSSKQGTTITTFVPSLESPMPKVTPTLFKTEKDVPINYIDHTLVEGQNDSTNKQDLDLITFADKDWFEIENVVNGRDIAPISPNRSRVEELNGVFPVAEKKRDGAEVFQDERRKMDQNSYAVFALEERMSSVEMVTSDWKTLQDQMTKFENNGYGQIKKLESSVELITSDWKTLQDRMTNFENKAYGRIKKLEEKVQTDITSLNEEVNKLNSELRKANDTIEACNKALVHILSEGDGDYGLSEAGENDQDEDESSGGSDVSLGSC